MPTLNWLTRKDDIARAERVPYCALESAGAKVFGNPTAGNLLIQGDNLDTMKALIPHFAGRMKCVYIDPPFNTGDAFEQYDDNLEHSQWLGMIYPRLELLRELLSENGSIWMSIDSHQAAYLKVIADEIFGRKNFINEVTNTTTEPAGFKTTSSKILSTANYILAYAKRQEKFTLNKLFLERDYDTAYSKYLENKDAHYSKWRWVNIADKVACELGCEDARQARKKLGKEEFDSEVAAFAVANADSIFQTAAITGGAKAKREKTLALSKEHRGKVFVHPGEDIEGGFYILNGRQMIFYHKSLKEINGRKVPGQFLTDVWTDIPWTGIANEGGVTLRNGKKPEKLLMRVLQLATKPGDLVLDSFVGSGTTAAVAHKMGRRYIGIEMGDHAVTHCIPRLESVIKGEQGGVSKLVNWKGGGGFHFYRLGDSIFLPDGSVNPKINFRTLAAHLWFLETQTPYDGNGKSPLLGVGEKAAIALLYNGILKDKSANGGNILTRKTLGEIRQAAAKKGCADDFPIIIYANGSRLAKSTLDGEGVDCKQIPYEIKRR